MTARKKNTSTLYISLIVTKPTLVTGVSVTLGEVWLDPSNFWEQSEYADPIPTPAPKAIDAQRVTGEPGNKILNHFFVKYFRLLFIHICTDCNQNNRGTKRTEGAV